MLILGNQAKIRRATTINLKEEGLLINIQTIVLNIQREKLQKS